MRVIRVNPGDWADRLVALQLTCLPHDDPYPIREGDVWHVVMHEGEAVGFSCVRHVSHELWYLARAGVLPKARGKGLQVRLIKARLRAVKVEGGGMVVTDCTTSNVASARSLIRAGFRPYWPEVPWALPDSIYWTLTVCK